MDAIQAFCVGLIFSFLGSIPPGTLNICVLQLGLEGKTRVALRFALAVSIIEYPYTWIAIRFESLITASPVVVQNFQLVSAIVMTGLGMLMLWSGRKPDSVSSRFQASGFRRGIVLSILNPMAIPFWIGITAYLKSQQWINIGSPLREHSYVLGTAVGVMILLTGFTFLAKRLGPALQNSKAVRLMPGLTLSGLGLYAFVKYFVQLL